MTETFESFPKFERFGAAPAPDWHWAGAADVEVEEWLVEDLVPKRSYIGFFGKRGAGKSFLALDLAMCGATETLFLGRDTGDFGSIYCVGEKKARHAKRERAWIIANDIEDPPAVMVRHGCPNLLDETDVDEFIAFVIAHKPIFAARKKPLGLIVFDTLSRALRGASVSDGDVAGRATEAIQRIIDQTGCAVATVAHMAKANEATTTKGAGEWEDTADALIRIERRDENGPVRTATVTKQSDEADGKEYAFDLDVVEVAKTQRGKLISSCVIRQLDAQPNGTKRASRRLTAAAMTVRSALGRLVDAGLVYTVPPCPGSARGQQGARVDELRAKAYEVSLQRASRPPADAPKSEQDKWLDARKKAFQRAMDALQEAGKIRVEGDFVWEL